MTLYRLRSLDVTGRDNQRAGHGISSPRQSRYPLFTMLALKNIDLRNDPDAHAFVKDEVVDVVFALADGAIMSREGPNHYRAGDALITGSTGDRWSVTRDRFDPKYDPVEPDANGTDGPYRAKAIPVLAKQIHEPFTIERVAGGDLLTGVAGDWVMQYAPGDYGLVERARFERVYRRRG